MSFIHPYKHVRSPRLEQRRRQRVQSGKGGRVDRFETLTPYTNTWWGRVGELLFLATHPDAVDCVAVDGNRLPYDVYTPSLGRVNVKTAVCQHCNSWPFQVKGNLRSDTLFLIGFNEQRSRVIRAWVIPTQNAPNISKRLTLNSPKYDGLPFEVSESELDSINRALVQILVTVGKEVHRDPDPIYDRYLWGKKGESIYKTLNPNALHVSALDQFSPHDFVTSSGKTVNVRLRRLGADNLWGFFKSSSAVDVYFFIGLDRQGERVLALFEVPSEAIPGKGFSGRPQGNSKWDRFRVPWVPCLVSELLGEDRSV